MPRGKRAASRHRARARRVGGNEVRRDLLRAALDRDGDRRRRSPHRVRERRQPAARPRDGQAERNRGSARDRRQPRQTDPSAAHRRHRAGVTGREPDCCSRSGPRRSWLRAGRPAEQVVLESHFDLRVLGFTAGVSIATALLFSLAPALRATRARRNRGSVGRSTSQNRLGRALVVVQVTLSVLLLCGAGLFTNAPQPERGRLRSGSRRHPHDAGRGRRAGTHGNAEDSSGISRRPCPARCNLARLRGACTRCRVCLPPRLRRYESAEPQYPW